jgi:hypothetical protein
MRQSAEYQLGVQTAREDAEGASLAELEVLIRRSQAGDWGDDYDRGYRNTLNEIIREASAHRDVLFAGLGKEKPSDVRGVNPAPPMPESARQRKAPPGKRG